MLPLRVVCSRARILYHRYCQMSTKQTAAVLLDDSNRGKEGKLTILHGFPIKEPSEHEVLVNVVLRPVNPSDIKSLTLTYAGFKPPTFPAVPGGEGVGRVVRSGALASKFAEGTRVVAVPWPGNTPSGGTWQQYVPVPEASLIAVPDAVTDEAAAQFLVNPVTAYGFLETLQVPEGKYLLQSAAGSTLGRMLIALAKHRGVRTINVVRRRAQVQELLDIGADAVICTEDEDVASRVEAITAGELAYAAVDPVGAAMAGTLASATRPGGTVYVYGTLGGVEVTIPTKDLVYREVTVKGFWLKTWLRELGERRAEVLQQLMQLMAKGVVAPHSGRKFPLEQANEAVAASKEVGRASEGKFFLEG